MNSIAKSHFDVSLAELEAQHFLAIQTRQDWQDVWELFYNDDWFQRKLNYSAHFAVRHTGLPISYAEDIKQEGLVEFAKSLQRDPTLGFCRSRGSFRAFISTIVHRSCQKGLRKFRNKKCLSIEEEFQHPWYEDQAGMEHRLDLRQLIGQIPEPYRGTVRQLCNGLSVSQIARKRKRSKRTIYRWIDKSIALLQSKYVDVDDIEL